MFSNITLGQYVSQNTFLHRINPKIKLIFSFLYVFLLFFITSLISLSFCVLVIFAVYFLCKFSTKLIFKNLKLIFFILIIASFFNLFFVKTGKILFKFLFFQITTDSILLTTSFILRIFLLISGSSLLTYTTLPLDLTLAIEELLKPLMKIKIPVNEISVMMSITLRFIPLLIEESNSILAAQKARGLNIFNKDGIFKKSKALSIFLIPLLVSSFKKADELAISMEARCFRIGKSRTRYKTLKCGKNDYKFSFCCIVFFILIIILNLF